MIAHLLEEGALVLTTRVHVECAMQAFYAATENRGPDWILGFEAANQLSAEIASDAADMTSSAATRLLPLAAQLAEKHRANPGVASAFRLVAAAAMAALPSDQPIDEHLDELLSIGDAADLESRTVVRCAVSPQRAATPCSHDRGAP